MFLDFWITLLCFSFMTDLMMIVKKTVKSEASKLCLCVGCSLKLIDKAQQQGCSPSLFVGHNVAFYLKIGAVCM